MPRAVCLRECFTYDRYHYQGREYNLPDSVVISPKNFRLLDAPIVIPPPPSIPTEIIQGAPLVVQKKARRRKKK